MTSELVTLLGDDEVGRVRRDKAGRLSFTYATSWREAPGAYPLSLSMPLAQVKHPSDVVSAYLWGLLPDNELILERWARRFQVSARSPFALLAHVGGDCAGAVQFVGGTRGTATRNVRSGTIAWLSEAQVAERLRALGEDIAAWRSATDVGQFSLAGAQPKTALIFDGARWGIPSGRTPTTHILKPGIAGLDGHAENEHFCLSLARELGLPTVTTEIRHFEDQIAIVVERYDRLRFRRGARRVHQEDVCQALGVPPSRKYESDGGPSPGKIVDLLREYSRHSEEDVETFVDAQAFNWLIAGTDAHAKNYSLLIGAGSAVRLAPIYDVASALPYRDMAFQKLKLAMKIGGKYRVRDIGIHEWQKACATLRVDFDATRARILRMAQALPDLASDQAKQCQRAGLKHPILERLTSKLCERGAHACGVLGRSRAEATRRR